VLRAFRVIAEVFELPALWSEIAGLPAAVPTVATDRLVLATRGLLDAGTRWFLAHRSESVAEELARFGPPVRRLIPRLPGLLRGREADGVRREAAELVGLGVPAALADRVAGLRYAVGLLDVVEVGELADRGRARLPVEEVAELYYALSERRWSATNYL
jgi:glutamate dehydrogenase